MIYKFGERLTEISQEEWEKEKCPAVFLTDSDHAEETLATAGIIYESEIQIRMPLPLNGGNMCQPVHIGAK